MRIPLSRPVVSRIGFFGGSFDPPHVCHLLACAFALATDEVDEVWAVPSFRHPFGKEMTLYAHRIRMVRLALRPLGPRVKISTLEKDIEGEGYTYDSLRELRRRRPDAKLRLIVGSDILGDRQRWKRFRDVERMAPLLVVPRASTTTRVRGDAFELPAISSSHLRAQLADGVDPGPWLPRSVYRYVLDHDLYHVDPTRR